MKEQATDSHPLSDLAYDWITLIQNKAQALMAYDQYIKDADQAVAGMRGLLPQGARQRQGPARRGQGAPGRRAAGQDGARINPFARRGNRAPTDTALG